MDDFIKRLMEIYKLVFEEQQKMGFPVLALNRSDYILDRFLNKFLQVEINTISVAYVTLSQQMFQFHKNFLNSKNIPAEFPIIENTKIVCQSINQTVNFYDTIYPSPNKSIAVMIISPSELDNKDHNNIVDHLKSKHSTQIIKLTLKQAGNKLKLHHNTKELTFRTIPISLLYYRTGYSPSDYPSQAEWAARAMLEKARCFKCPSIGLQLAGTKKVQQCLSEPGALEEFLGADASKIRRYFTEIKGTKRPQIIEALKESGKWLMKPSREGGG